MPKEKPTQLSLEQAKKLQAGVDRLKSRIPVTKKAPSTFGDAFEFYPDSPRKLIKDIEGKQLSILDCKLVPEYGTQYGTSDMLLVLAYDGEDTFTFPVFQQVIKKKILQAQTDNLLPLIGTIIHTDKGAYSGYYDIR